MSEFLHEINSFSLCSIFITKCVRIRDLCMYLVKKCYPYAVETLRLYGYHSTRFIILLLFTIIIDYELVNY